jgi:hypothetical protein
MACQPTTSLLLTAVAATATTAYAITTANNILTHVQEAEAFTIRA